MERVTRIVLSFSSGVSFSSWVVGAPDLLEARRVTGPPRSGFRFDVMGDTMLSGLRETLVGAVDVLARSAFCGS